MPKRSRKPADLNKMAKALVDEATDEEPVDPYGGKDPAAVELGRKGGRKGGRVRADKMTAQERSDAAKKAAEVRWANQRTS